MPKPAKGDKIKNINIDTVMVLSVDLRVFPAGTETITLTYASGYMQGQDFVPKERHQIIIEGADFQAIAAHVPNGVDNLWTELENLLYAEIDKDSGVV